jgi:Putative MetA-pathway of phenol degradation
VGSTRTRWLRPSVAVAAVLLFSQDVYSAHPLLTEDTGTQGKGGWQLELNGERNRDEGVRGAQAEAKLTYGVTDAMDVAVAAPFQDLGAERGMGDTVVELKWRFWERGPLSLGLQPGLTLPSARDGLGLGAGRATWGGLLIASYEGERWAFHTHAGYRRNRNTLGERESLTQVAGAVLFKATEQVRPLLDFSRSTNPDPASRTALRETVLGVIWQVTKDLDLDAGYRRGNSPAIDRALMAGVTLRW